MDILTGILLIFGLLAAPGLIAVYVARQVSPSPEPDPDASQTTLTALSVALVVTTLELLVLSGISLWCTNARVWGGLTIGELAGGNRWGAFQQRPALAAFVLSAEFLVHLSLMALIGYLNLGGKFVAARLRDSGLTLDDPVAEALQKTRNVLGTEDVFAVLVLRNGSRYSGSVQSVSFKPFADGSRDVLLQQAEEIIGDTTRPLAPGDPSRSAVLVNTRDIVAIEMAYVDEAPTSDPDASTPADSATPA